MKEFPEYSWFTRYRPKPNQLTPEEKEIVRRRVEEAKRRALEKLRKLDER